MKYLSFIQNFQTVILANGAFPKHNIPLSFLQNAKQIICCDGATENLLKIGLEPDFIVGDLDSISDKLKTVYTAILHHNPDQETNDLTKAVKFCCQNNWTEITILGATGKREDHSLANISLLTTYAEHVQVQMLTDYGVFTPIIESTIFESYQGQQVSLYSMIPETLISTDKLKYPLNKRALTTWWEGTLNEALENEFTIEIDKGQLLIFREYKNKFTYE